MVHGERQTAEYIYTYMSAKCSAPDCVISCRNDVLNMVQGQRCDGYVGIVRLRHR